MAKSSTKSKSKPAQGNGGWKPAKETSNLPPFLQWEKIGQSLTALVLERKTIEGKKGKRTWTSDVVNLRLESVSGNLRAKNGDGTLVPVKAGDTVTMTLGTKLKSQYDAKQPKPGKTRARHRYIDNVDVGQPQPMKDFQTDWNG